MRVAPILVIVLLAVPALLMPPPAATASHAATSEVVAPHGALATGEVRDAAAVWIGDRAYLFGGVDASGAYLNDVVEYDPANQTSTLLPVALPSPRAGLAAAVVDGAAYLFGGAFDSCGECHAYFDGVLRFDPRTGALDQVVPGSEAPTPRVGMAAVADAGKVYLFGGCDAWTSSCQQDVLRYDPATPAAAPVAMAASLPHPGRGGMAAGGDGAGLILLAGGEEPGWFDGDFFVNGGPRADVYQYDPLADALTPLDVALPAPRAHGDGFLVDGRLFVVGGVGTAGALGPLARVDPLASGADLSATLAVTGAAVAWSGTAAYVFGGDRPAEELSPSASVTQVSPVPLLQSATVTGDEVTLTFDRPLAEGWVDGSGFTLSIRGIGFPLESGHASGSEVVLSFPPGVPSGDAGFVRLASAGDGPTDPDGSHALTFVDAPVQVLTPPGELPGDRALPLVVWTGQDALVVGGVAADACRACASSSSILSYDPRTGVFTTLARVETGCCVSGGLVGDDVVFFGGASSDVHRFDRDTGVVDVVGSLPGRLQTASAATDGARHLYVFGGYSPSRFCEFECVVTCIECAPTGTSYHDAILRLDTQAEAPVAEVIGALPSPRAYTAAAVDPTPTAAHPAGRAFVVGGENGTDILLDVVLVDLATGAATNLTDLSLPAPLYGAVAAWVGDSVLVLGGSTWDGPVDTAYRLFPDRPEALVLPVPLGVALVEAGAAWNGTAALVVGGTRWGLETTEHQRVPLAYAPDLAPPDVQVVPDAAANTLGWHTAPVTIAFTATDASALAYVQRAVGDEAFTDAAPLALTDGEWSLRARARDAWGNENETAPVLVRVDTLAPTVLASGSEGTLAGPAASVAFAFSEPMDPAATEAALQNATGWTLAWSADATHLFANHSDVPVGTHALTLGTAATDAHGVPLAEGATRTVTRAAPPPPPPSPPAPPPTTTPGAPQGLALVPTAGGVRVTWSPPASDGGAAITHYLVQAGADTRTVPGTELDLPLAPGERRDVRVAAVNANGAGPAATITAQRPPVTAVAVVPAAPDGANGWYVTRPVVTLTPTPADATLLVDLGAGETAYTGPLTMPPGETTLRWRAIAPGGVEPTREAAFRVDGAPPTATPDFMPRAILPNESVVVRAAVTDDDAGVAEVVVEVAGARVPLADDGAGAYAATLTPPEGEHEVVLVATDHAGRETRAGLGRLVVAGPPVEDEPAEPPAEELEPTSAETPEEDSGEASLQVVQGAGVAVGVDAGARGVVLVRVLGLTDPQDVVIVVIDEDGHETVLPVEDGVAEWDTTVMGDGFYTVEARRGGEDGLTLASAEVLVRNPAITLAGVTTGLAGAALLLAALSVGGPMLGSALGSTTLASLKQAVVSKLDFLGFAQEVAVDAGQDKLRDKTKDRLRLERQRRIRSVVAASISAVLLAGLWAVSESGGWKLEPWLASLPTVASAAFIVTVLKWSSEGSLAWVTHAAPRFRIWVTGLVSLAASVTFFHSPFGYPGFVEEVEREGDHRRRLEGVRALGTIAGAAAFMLPFLALAKVTPFSFVEIGLLIAITNVATSAMPFKPLPGGEVWAWSKLGALGFAATAFALYAVFVAALVPLWVLWATGIAGVATQAAVMLSFRKTLGPAPRRVPVEVRVPVQDKDAEARREPAKQRR